MKRLKGRYVAQVVIDIDTPATQYNIKEVAMIKGDIMNGEFNRKIKGLIYDYLEDVGQVSISQLYADAYEVDDGE